MFEVRPGLWTIRLPLPWPEISHVNAYLVSRADEGAILVDCGTAGHPSCWDALLVGLEKAGHSLGDIRDLVITHAHSDHLGLAARIVAEGGCTMWMHGAHEAFSEGATEGERIREARGRRALQEGVPEEILERYDSVIEEEEGAIQPIPPFRELRGGMRVPSLLGDWTVIETPGHAPSHVSLYEPQERLLIIGDLVSRIFVPWFDYGYTADPVAELVSSLYVARELDVAVALPGHGRPIEDLDDVIQMHLSELDRRLDMVEAAVGEREGAAAYALARAVFGEPASEYQEVGFFIETVAYLRHLRLIGRVIRETGEDDRFHYRLPERSTSSHG